MLKSGCSSWHQGRRLNKARRNPQPQTANKQNCVEPCLRPQRKDFKSGSSVTDPRMSRTLPQIIEQMSKRSTNNDQILAGTKTYHKVNIKKASSAEPVCDRFRELPVTTCCRQRRVTRGSQPSSYILRARAL